MSFFTLTQFLLSYVFFDLIGAFKPLAPFTFSTLLSLPVSRSVKSLASNIKHALVLISDPKFHHPATAFWESFGPGTNYMSPSSTSVSMLLVLLEEVGPEDRCP